MLPRLSRVVLLTALCSAVVVVPAAPVRAEKEDARKHYDRATAAFGLGRYADAAVEYEAAFRLRPDPALLYNCAQSYRLAGNKARAVELYRNYVRLYGDAPNADDARNHLNNLELEVAAERTLTPRPLTAPPVVAAPPPPPAPIVARPPVATRSQVAVVAPVATKPFEQQPPPVAPDQPPSQFTLQTPPAPPPPAQDVHVDVAAVPPPAATAADEQRPFLHRPWFWAAVGAVVVGATVAILLATSGDEDPKATLGVVVGN